METSRFLALAQDRIGKIACFGVRFQKTAQKQSQNGSGVRAFLAVENDSVIVF